MFQLIATSSLEQEMMSLTLIKNLNVMYATKGKILSQVQLKINSKYD